MKSFALDLINELEMRKAPMDMLVTGGAAVKSSHLVKCSVGDLRYVTTPDNLFTGKPENLPQAAQARFVWGDIRDYTSSILKSASTTSLHMGNYGKSRLVNSSAIFLSSISEPAHVNRIAPKNLTQVSSACSCPRSPSLSHESGKYSLTELIR